MNELADDPNHARAEDASLKPVASAESSESLDNLAKELVKEKSGETPAAPATGLDDASAAAARARELAAKGTTPAAPAASAAPAAPAAPVDDAAKAKAEAEQKAAAEAAAAEEARKAAEAAAAKTPDALDAIELPPNVKPKSAQAFDNLKSTARAEIARVAKELTDKNNALVKAQEELAAARAAQGKISPEVQQELDSLRQEHAALDVKNDPEFKKFDNALQANTELIYSKLAENGVEPEAIAKIKELGGPDNVDWEVILPKLPPQVGRLIQATLVDNARVLQSREKALADANTNAVEFTKKRTAREQQDVQNSAMEFTKPFSWMQVKEISSTATPEEKAALEAHNADAQGALNKLTMFLNERSPSRYAELAVGTVFAYKLKAQVEALQKELTALKSDTKLAEVTKERDALKTKIEGIKRAQMPHVAGEGIIPPAPAKKTDLSISGDEALDSLAKGVVAGREE